VLLVLPIDQPVTHENAMHRRTGRRVLLPDPAQLERDPTGTPPTMLTTQLADQSLDRSRNPMR
tara:strand:- start:610 stop:798 length:189 start_codon:yes stop_codon:yes gene_type:complete